MNNVNRVYDSAGPEGKVRGTPQQIIDKYLSLARDAQTSGDRVMAENYLQHAEHYQRLVLQATSQQEQARREQAEADGAPAEQANGAAAPEPAEPAEQPAREEASEPAKASGGGEISGMAMIDSDEASAGSLLVDAEPAAKPAPRRRNGDGRGRRAGPKPEANGEATELHTAHASADEAPSEAKGAAES